MRIVLLRVVTGVKLCGAQRQGIGFCSSGMCRTDPQIAARCWTQEQINFLSDVIAAGTVVKTAPLRETSPSGERAALRGVEITFSISQLFKGRIPSDGTLVVRYLLPVTSVYPIENRAYLLFLAQDGPCQFRPTSGPEEAALSIRRDLRAEALAQWPASLERREPAHFPVPVASTARTSPELVAA